MLRLVELGIRRVLLGIPRNSVVKRSTKAVLAKHSGGAPRIARALHYGANHIDAKHLAIWYLVGTNEELRTAQDSGLAQSLAIETRVELRRRGYPHEAIDQIAVGVESNENVDRAGGWLRYFR